MNLQFFVQIRFASASSQGADEEMRRIQAKQAGESPPALRISDLFCRKVFI